MMLAHTVVDIAELGVAIRVLVALDLLDRRLQTVTGVMQQPPDQPLAGCMPLPGQCCRELPCGLDRPPQWRLRITPHVRVDQSLQRHRQLRVHRLGPPATGAGTAYPTGIGGTAVEFVHPAGYRRTRRPSRMSHHGDPAAPRLSGFDRHPQPALPLVEHRRQQLKLERYLALTIGGPHHRHTE